MVSIFKKRYNSLDPKTGEKIVKLSKNWYTRFRDADGTIQYRTLVSDKQLSQKMAIDFVCEVERQKMGFCDEKNFAQYKRPIAEFFIEFKNHLEAKGDTSEYIQQTLIRIKNVGRQSGWHFLCDMKIMDVEKFICNLIRIQRLSHNCANGYIRSLKSFTNWLFNNDKIQKNPFQKLKLLNTADDKRHSRRALSMEEFRLLLDATQSGPIRQSLSGTDRAMLYTLAAWTGFRKGELGSLTRNQIFLNVPNPYILIQAAYSKRRRNDVQYLHSGLVELLRRWLKKKDTLPNEILFPITRAACGLERQTNKMIEADLACARKFWIAEADSPEKRERREKSDFLKYKDSQGNFADFHGLRHTFITNLFLSGVNPRTAQSLARHSDISLTMNIYTHVNAEVQIKAINSLPAPNFRK